MIKSVFSGYQYACFRKNKCRPKVEGGWWTCQVPLKVGNGCNGGSFLAYLLSVFPSPGLALTHPGGKNIINEAVSVYFRGQVK